MNRPITGADYGPSFAVADTRPNLVDELQTGLAMPQAAVRNIRGFIDEIPLDQPTTNPIAPACDFLCHHASQDLAA